MMHLTLIPQQRADGDTPLALHRAGDVLIINGQALDLSVIPEGATLPATAVSCLLLVDTISRIGGVLHLTLILPHGWIPDPAPAEAMPVLSPEPILVTKDGPVPLPSYNPPQEAAE